MGEDSFGIRNTHCLRPTTVDEIEHEAFEFDHTSPVLGDIDHSVTKTKLLLELLETVVSCKGKNDGGTKTVFV